MVYSLLSKLVNSIFVDILGERPEDVEMRSPRSDPSKLEVSFRKVPNKLVKFYEVKIEGFKVPNVPFFRQALWTPKVDSSGSSRQSGVLENIESGWRYKVTARAIYENDETGRWSQTASLVVGK